MQFTPDLVPSDLVGTRIWQPDTGEFDTELGPVFANLRARRRDQPRTGESAVGTARGDAGAAGDDQRRELRGSEPFLVLATQNPIESEGTYPLPEAQVDRFLFKLLVDYPSVEDEVGVLDLLEAEPVELRSVLQIDALLEHRRAARAVYVDRTVKQYAVSLADATRHPAAHGLTDLEGLIEFGASPRASIGMMQGAQALAMLRGRNHATIADVRDLAADVLRHRIVLTYDALADGVSPDTLVERVLGQVGGPALVSAAA